MTAPNNGGPAGECSPLVETKMTVSSTEEIARYFDVLANDQEGCISHGWVRGAAKKRAEIEAAVWRDAADLMRRCEFIPPAQKDPAP